MSELTYPLIFTPVYQDYIWGGDRLADHFDRDTNVTPCAESWEISDRPEGESRVENGPLEGKTLSELVRLYGEALMGVGVVPEKFPLLIKLIDAKNTLSVQVHPNDETAPLTGGEAKTEMWVILDADDEACVYLGLQDGVTEEAFRASLKDGRVEELLTKLPVKKDDVLFVPGGSVHAIGGGCLILEVQQNSNTTYRVYDWGRLGHDGEPRELHVEDAMKVIRWSDDGSGIVRASDWKDLGNGIRRVLASDNFVVDALQITNRCEYANGGESFHALFSPDADLEVRCSEGRVLLRRGASCLIPAAVATYELHGPPEGARVYRISVAG